MQRSDNGQTIGPNYAMNWRDHLNLGQYLRDFFNSSVYLNTGIYQPGPGGSMASSFGLAIYNAENLATMIREIADTMINSHTHDIEGKSPCPSPSYNIHALTSRLLQPGNQPFCHSYSTVSRAGTVVMPTGLMMPKA